MESTAYIKNIAISPKKIRFLLKDVKRMQPAKALHHLKYTNKAPARHLYKAIESALANAKNTLNTSEDLLEFKALIIEEGRKLKRFRAGGRGMAKPYLHKYSHIKVIIAARGVAAGARPAKKVKAQDAKPAASQEEEKKKEQAKPKIAVPRDMKARGQQNMVKQRTVTRQKKG